MKIKLLFLLQVFCTLGYAQLNYPAQNFTLIGHIDPETGQNSSGDKYSGCWGWYQATKGREYAIACSHRGTYWVDVTNPQTPVISDYHDGFKPGCTWREAKTYQNYCYVISDDAVNNSFQIFDMQYLPDSVVKVYDGDSIFRRGHTLWVDGDKLYVASVTYSNNLYDNMNVYSLATPTAPTLIRSLSDDYPFISTVHDMLVRNDTVFASCANQGLHVFQLTSANTFTQLGSLTSYSTSGYNHSSALTPDGKTLVFMDEVPAGLPIKIADVTNLSNIQIKAYTNQYTLTTPHNPYIVSNKYCFASSYQEGLQLYDISNPSAPQLVGYFDTYPQAGGNTGSWLTGYHGQWGAYPYFPSKTIFALDQLNGLFMLRTDAYSNNPSSLSENAKNNGFLVYPNPAGDRVYVQLPLVSGATVEIVDLQGKKILQQFFSSSEHQAELETGDFTNGIYFIKVSGDGLLVSTQKLIISK